MRVDMLILLGDDYMKNFLLSIKAFLLSTNEEILKDVAGDFSDTMGNIVQPILIVIGAVVAVYIIYLGVLYAKAEDANKRKEVQGRLIGAAIGLVIALVGITLCSVIDWANIASNWQ